MKRNKALLFMALPLVIVMTACGTTEVIQTGPESYEVSAQYGSINGSWDRAQKEAIEKAKDYCKSQGKGFLFRDEKREGVPGYSMQVSHISFGCGSNLKELLDDAEVNCGKKMQSTKLDSIRSKVELMRNPEQPVPFAIAVNDQFPSSIETAAIAEWAVLRETCLKDRADAINRYHYANSLEQTQVEKLASFSSAANARISELIVLLYQQKLTYGEFAKMRFDIGSQSAELQRKYKEALLLADEKRKAEQQQMLVQQLQTNIAAWTAYRQSIEARQPQNVHVEGAVQLRSNCRTSQSGYSLNTICD